MVKDFGIEKFREMVLEERKILPHDPRWTEYLQAADQVQEEPLRPGGELPEPASEAFARWLKT
ncbi:hypothetical protein MYX77_14925, partial [Acidobacteriia bacterium AH_259_A11_L15]|nr:hypothetical protein [Acidobacteriia bacterium AH_259_A11_L15]